MIQINTLFKKLLNTFLSIISHILGMHGIHELDMQQICDIFKNHEWSTWKYIAKIYVILHYHLCQEVVSLHYSKYSIQYTFHPWGTK